MRQLKRLIFLPLKNIYFITSSVLVVVAIFLSGSFPLFMSSSLVYGWYGTDFLVSGGQADQVHPQIAYSGQGSFLVVWENRENGASSDIYGAIVPNSIPTSVPTPANNQLQVTPFPICTATGDQIYPLAVWNGSNYFVIWEDARSGNLDISGTRVSVTGSVLDNPPSAQNPGGGMAISSAGGDQTQPALVWNAHDQNYLIVWEDHRADPSRIYVMRISKDFQLLDGFTADSGGLPISGAGAVGADPCVAWNGTNYLVAWENPLSASACDIYGCRLSSSSGQLQVAGSVISITKGDGLKLNPAAASDGKDFFVAWDVHGSDGYADVAGILVSADGSLDSRGSFPIAEASQHQLNPSIVWCDSHYMVTWKDTRYGKPDVCFVRLSSAGSFLDSQTKSSGIPLYIYGSSLMDSPSAVVQMADPGDYLLVWEESRSNNFDIYCEHYHAVLPPVLSWTGETNYQNAGVNPATGPAGTSFMFRVKYQNASNLPPLKKQLWIDQDDDGIYSINPSSAVMDIIMDMTQETQGNNYAQGVIYTLTAPVPVQFAGDGKINYRFVFSDGTNEVTGEPTKSHQILLGNSPASLVWMGTSDYESDGVNPNSAQGGSSFTFMVRYRDLENDSPSTTLQVWVDVNHNNIYDQDEKFDMSAFDSRSFADGRGYHKSISCLYVPDSTTTGAISIKYRFNFTNTDGPVEGEPSTDHSFSITPASSVPVLSWTSESGFTQGARGESAGGNYEFHVSYQDLDNDLPVQEQVWIDENGDNSFSQEEKHDMEQLTSSDNNVTDGKIYQFQANISSSGGEAIRYKFIFSDGKNMATGEPSLTGGQIAANPPVYLTWTQEQGYTTDGVNPDSGPAQSGFQFRVKYVNLDNFPPEIRQLWLDENNDGQYEESEKYTMEDADTLDTDYSDGKIYGYSLKINPSGTPVNLAYKFVFQDIYSREASGGPTEDSLKVLVLEAAAQTDPNTLDPQQDPNTSDDQGNTQDPPPPNNYVPQELKSSQGGCFILSLPFCIR
jgi:hypothetical protein